MEYFSFGKHDGEAVDDVWIMDPGYIIWLMSQDWFPEKYPELHDAIRNLDDWDDDMVG